MSSYFSERTVPAGTGFRGLRQDLKGFLSAEREKAECSFRSGKRTRKKREFFRSKGNHVYGAKGWVLSLALQRNDPEKIAMISLTWPTIRPAKRYGGCEFSFYLVSLFIRLSFFSPYLLSAYLWCSFFFSSYIRNNYAEKDLPYVMT